MDEGGITPGELQAELNTLLSLRRRSTSQPSDGIDPDLPPSPSKYSHLNSLTPPASPTYTSSNTMSSPSHSPVSIATSPSAIFHNTDAEAGPSSGGAALGGLPHFSRPNVIGQEDNINEDIALSGSDGAFGDGLSDLFWLPARLHPEIAPQEFRNFIKDQTKPENLMRRSGSMLGRKKSTLSKQYQPTDSDIEASDNEKTTSQGPNLHSRAGSFRRSTGLERLTINDLQRLESLARQAAEEGQQGVEGEAQLKRLVRRSLSLNPAAILGAADMLHERDDDEARLGTDEADSPLMLPPPGSILRRSARTKIRKNSLLGDGGGHRFAPSKKGTRNSPFNDNEESKERHIIEEQTLSERKKESGESQVSINTVDLENDHALQQKQLSITGKPSGPSMSPDMHSQPLPYQYMSATPPSTSCYSGNIPDTSLSIRPGQNGDDLSMSPTVPLSPITSHQVVTSQIPMPTYSSSTTRFLDQLKYDSQDEHQLPPSTGPKSTKKLDPSPIPIPPQKSAPYSHPAGSKSSEGPESLQVQPDLPRKSSKDVLLHRAASSNPDTLMPTANSEQPLKPVEKTPQSPMQPSDTKHGRSQVYVHPQALPHSHIPVVQPLDPRRQREPPALPSMQSQVPAAAPVSLPTASHAATLKEKEKKSGWARLGLSRSGREDAANDVDDSVSIHSTSSGRGTGTKDKKGKKGRKEKEAPPPEKKTHHGPLVAAGEKEKSESSGSFFGGLFGSKKKSDSVDQENVRHAPNAVQLATPPPTASGMLTANGKYVNFYRLPIHIERAVYRLSHIKLANPRRPLYEQVLISNLMFWYLGVINKPAVPPSLQMQQQQQQEQYAEASVQEQNIANVAIISGEYRPSSPGNHSSVNLDTDHRPNLMQEAPASARPEAFARGRTNAESDDRFVQYEHAPPSTESYNPRPVSHPPSMSTFTTHQIDPPVSPETLSTSLAANPSHTQGNIYSHQDTLSTLPLTPPVSDSWDSDDPRDFVPNHAKVQGPPETSFQVHRPHRTASMQPMNATPISNPPVGQMQHKELGLPILAEGNYDDRRRTRELDSLDIISTYADEERRKSHQTYTKSFPMPSPIGLTPAVPLLNGVRSQGQGVHTLPGFPIEVSSGSKPLRSASPTSPIAWSSQRSYQSSGSISSSGASATPGSPPLASSNSMQTLHTH